MRIETRISQFRFIEIAKVKIAKNFNPFELKYALRQACREACNGLYFKSIELTIPIETEVEVKNFGRWLFGVKGFMGHYKQKVLEDNVVEIYIPDLKEAKELIKCGLEELKKQGIII